MDHDLPCDSCKQRGREWEGQEKLGNQFEKVSQILSLGLAVGLIG